MPPPAGGGADGRRRREGGRQAAEVMWPWRAEGSTDPIADRRHLGDAAADIGERDRANEGVVGGAENEERIGDVALDVADVALDPAAEGGARQIILEARKVPRASERRGFRAAAPPSAHSRPSPARAIRSRLASGRAEDRARRGCGERPSGELSLDLGIRRQAWRAGRRRSRPATGR